MTALRRLATAPPALPTAAGACRALRAAAGGADVAQMAAALGRAVGRVRDLPATTPLRSMAGPPGLMAAAPEVTLEALLERVGQAGSQRLAGTGGTRAGRRPPPSPRPTVMRLSTSDAAPATDGASQRRAVEHAPAAWDPPARTAAGARLDGDDGLHATSRPTAAAPGPRDEDGRDDAARATTGPATTRDVRRLGSYDVPAAVPATSPGGGPHRPDGHSADHPDRGGLRHDSACSTAPTAAVPRATPARHLGDAVHSASSAPSRAPSRRHGQLAQLAVLATTDDASTGPAATPPDGMHDGRAPAAAMPTEAAPPLRPDFVARLTSSAVGAVTRGPHTPHEHALGATAPTTTSPTTTAPTALGDPAVLTALGDLLDSLLRREAQRHGLDGDLL